MQTCVIISAGVALVALYIAWLNGAFRRCPHCGKIGAWRYDDAGPVLENKDADGSIQQSARIRTCRKCGKRVLDKWSDAGGRTFEKLEN